MQGQQYTVTMDILASPSGPVQLANGKSAGMPIANMRLILGGDEGTLTDPFDRKAYQLSLKPYAHLDAKTAYIAVRFRRRYA